MLSWNLSGLFIIGDYSKRHRPDDRGSDRGSDRGGSERESDRGGSDKSSERGEPGPSGGRGRGDGPRGRGDGARGRGDGARGRGGRGGGRGGRGGRRGRREEDYDMVITRPKMDGVMMKKQAAICNGAKEARLQANFFQVECRPDWCIYHYRVDFKPDEQDTRIKKKLLKVHAQSLGAYIFDGSSLYVSNKLSPDVSLSY